MEDSAYCAAQVRDQDSDRYVTALFAPADRRADLLALYAFNLELARSREVVSEPMLGRIRLQWWRDAIDECYRGSARRHQVVQPLAAAIKRHDLSRELFDRIIDGREADFDSWPMERLDRLEAYAEATSGTLNLLALRILGVRDARVERVAVAVGTGWALTGMIRGLRHLLLTGRPPLPQELMERHGLTQVELRSLKSSRSLCKAVEEIHFIALKYINKGHIKIPSQAAAALLPAVLAEAYLKRLARTDHDPFDERNIRPLRQRAWRLMIPALTGRI